MVPLESVTKRPSSIEPVLVPRKRVKTPESAEPRRRPPRRFRIVDVMTRQLLLEDAGAREAVDALKGVRSVVDVNVYVWEDEQERWRLLTFAEESAMLELAHS